MQIEVVNGVNLTWDIKEDYPMVHQIFHRTESDGKNKLPLDGTKDTLQVFFALLLQPMLQCQ